MQFISQILDWIGHHLQVLTVTAAVLGGGATALNVVIRFLLDRKVLVYHFAEATDQDAYAPHIQPVLNQYNDDTPRRRRYARVWELSLRNAGNQPIKRDDFDGNQPIYVEIGGAGIACVTVNRKDNRTDPDDLPVAIDPPELACATVARINQDDPTAANELSRTCAVQPLLLNPRDRITLQFALVPTGYPVTARVTTRIAGIRRPTLGLSDRAQLLQNGTEVSVAVMTILISLVYGAEQHVGAQWPIVGPLIAPVERFITQFNVLEIATVIAILVLGLAAVELIVNYQRTRLARLFRKVRRWFWP